MARFRGSIQGQRGEASRLGGTKSGLHVTANGWNIGARVSVFADSDDNDCIQVSLTGGSNGSISSVLLGTWKRSDIEALARKRA